ncbi:MAG: alpha/beta hydrolase [Pirellulaceae bacterium]|nr:alpha/beta hydrolase [Pirellulaceae bacterium]
MLDDRNDVRAQGSYDECLAALSDVKRTQNLQPIRGKAVLLLHGLAAPRWSMNLLAQHLEKHGGYHALVVEYASLRSSVDDQARGLAAVIRNLDQVDEINLVGHSLGNIVIRRYLAGDDAAGSGWRPDPRVARIVMIAPPNHGSITAMRLADFRVFRKLFGSSGQQLGKAWDDLEARLATPRTEFGIIAGGFGNSWGLSLSVPGDDDGRIGVATTLLEGATDFIIVPAVHEFIANDPRVFALTRQFLDSGYFVSPERKQSIPVGSTATLARELK